MGANFIILPYYLSRYIHHVRLYFVNDRFPNGNPLVIAVEQRNFPGVQFHAVVIIRRKGIFLQIDFSGQFLKAFFIELNSVDIVAIGGFIDARFTDFFGFVLKNK